MEWNKVREEHRQNILIARHERVRPSEHTSDVDANQRMNVLQELNQRKREKNEKEIMKMKM